MESSKASELEKLLSMVPEDVLKEVEEYEKSEREKYRRSGSKKPFPSNEDVAEAIKEVCGGIITRGNIDTLFEAVKKHLEEQGFETRFLTEGRFWRLVTNLVKKGVIKVRL